jgi:hypothetical protein
MKSEGLPEDVRVNVATGRRTGVVLAVSGGEEWAQSRLLTPAEARVLAAHLWRAANEVDGVADWLPDLIVKRLLDPPPTDLEPLATDAVFDDAPPPRWGAMHMKGR